MLDRTHFLASLAWASDDNRSFLANGVCVEKPQIPGNYQSTDRLHNSEQTALWVRGCTGQAHGLGPGAG